MNCKCSYCSKYAVFRLEEQYQGQGYGVFKKDLAELLGEELTKIQARYKEITQGDYLDNVLKEGAKKAGPIARKTLSKVERKIGITIYKR